MSSAFPSDAEDSRSSSSQNLYPNYEQLRPRLRRDSNSSASPNRPSGDGELASTRPGSALTVATSVTEGNKTRHKLRDQWDLQVTLKQTLPGGATRIDAELKCSSVILCDSSRQFKAMIGTEGRTRAIGFGSRRNLDLVIPPHYTAEAAGILICSMHHFNHYRRIASFEDLLHLSIACWDLECSTGPIENLGNSSKVDLWRSPAETGNEEGNRQDYFGWVFVALVFGWDDIFREASQEVVMGGEMAIECGEDYLPEGIRRAIKEKRAKTIAGIISFVRQTSQSYLASDSKFGGVIFNLLKTLDERLQNFGVRLIASETTEHVVGDVPSARELITHLKELPEILPEYQDEAPDLPLALRPTQPPALPPPPPSVRSHRSAESSLGGGRASTSRTQRAHIENFRMGSTSGALSSSVASMWHKRQRVFEWAGGSRRPSRVDVSDCRPAAQQENVRAQEWRRVRAEFLARLEDEVRGFGAMELEEFRELRERRILQPVSGSNRDSILSLGW